jgi:hypothetical protein
VQTAAGEFLHSVCDGSRQQLAAEVRGCGRFVETTPLLTQFADVERQEVPERLRIDLSIGALTDRDDGSPDFWRTDAS